MKKTVLVIGNSSGIGLEATKVLLLNNLRVVGISRSSSEINDTDYEHYIFDVSSADYRVFLDEILNRYQFDICIYCAGIIKMANLSDLQDQEEVFAVNLTSAIQTTNLVMRHFHKRKKGHFIGISSIADILPNRFYPAYNASKSALSRYWEALAYLLLTQKNYDILISNVRFGPVQTKLAKCNPRVMKNAASANQAGQYIFEVIKNPRIRATHNFFEDIKLRFVYTINFLRFYFIRGYRLKKLRSVLDK